MSRELPTPYQQFIHKSRYSRWLDDKGRRETWEETVDRYLNFITDGKPVDAVLKAELREAILNCEVMPSMRAMMTAGPAAARCNVAMYNCAYTPVDSLDTFAEILYILMCGTGVGYSVERANVEQLPKVPAELALSASGYEVQDSKEGWAEALRYLLICIFDEGLIPQFDYSLVRPKGARLKTMGGRSSGPEPLKKLLDFVRDICISASGRRLKPIEVHDICCMIGEVVVVGGVRRSAMIALFDRDEKDMAACKSGDWWKTTPWRALANNSAVYESKPSLGEFLADWTTIYKSFSGEPGIFSRDACCRITTEIGRKQVRWGTNPCSEIILAPNQFCNLTEVVCRKDDTTDTLVRKVILATILGTLQASFTDFKFLSNKWKETTEREALLGVSLTGITDVRDLGDIYFPRLSGSAIHVNQHWAKKLGINRAAAITCVKPSGTVSQLVDSASGMHPRHSEYYIRRVRGDIKDPLTTFLMSQGVDWEWAIGKENETVVFSFPTASPAGARTRKDLTAVEHLELWLKLQREWCEHKPSVTINIAEDEWFAVADFVWKNFDWMSGVAFLPYDGGTYQQAPYEEITLEQYKELTKLIFALDWERLAEFESEDQTTGSQTYACTGGVCEIVDITL